MQVPRPAIIPQPLPQLQHLFQVCLCQRFHRGKAGHKPVEIRQHRGHLRLLQHDLADPDPVGRGLLAPGHGPGMLLEPMQKRVAKSLDVPLGGLDHVAGVPADVKALAARRIAP